MSQARYTTHGAIARALIGCCGGLLMAMAFVAGGSALLVAAGWASRADAAVTTGMLSFLVWTSAVLLAFAVNRAWQAAAWIAGGCGLLTVLGWLCLR